MKFLPFLVFIFLSISFLPLPVFNVPVPQQEPPDEPAVGPATPMMPDEELLLMPKQPAGQQIPFGDGVGTKYHLLLKTVNPMG
jgi:hypothetical protein